MLDKVEIFGKKEKILLISDSTTMDNCLSGHKFKGMIVFEIILEEKWHETAPKNLYLSKKKRVENKMSPLSF